MMSLKQRGEIYWMHGTISGEFLRVSLKTRNKGAAAITIGKVERAIAEGKRSELWSELRGALPASTFKKIADAVGYIPTRGEKIPCWSELWRTFHAHSVGMVARKKLRQSTLDRYTNTVKWFARFLESSGVEQLAEISRPVVDSYKTWRLGEILKKKQARGGGAIDLELAHLHHVFAYAVEREMLIRNPVKMEGRPGANPENGAMPFSEAELASLREHADEDRLIFLLLRHTGLRAGDAVSLTWNEVDFPSRKIVKLAQKNRKLITVPLHEELHFALEAEKERRGPKDGETVLLNPATGKAMNGQRLYYRVRYIGRRAGVVHAHPHRFRDTFACDLLLKGASVYYVAKLLGDSAQTIETHYAPFVPEHIERARGFIEAEGGLEADRTKITHPATPGRTPN